jgi:outer membrane biosynthesis protein TonB
MAADRKQTPDILGSLLGDKKPEEQPEEKPEDTSKPEYHKDSKPEEQQARKPVEKPTSKTVSQKTQQPDKQLTEAPKPVREPSREASGEKVKATYYLAIEAIEALEEGWYQLRKLAPTDARTGISKSLIVEEALQIVLEELEKAGQKSRIAKKILKE